MNPQRFVRISASLAPAVAAATYLASSPAFAHHSFAMFDQQKNTALEGTIKEVQWANPHVWVQILVKDAVTGKEVEWSIEATSVYGLQHQGWTRKSVNAGDTAVVVIHPLKDGTPGGSLVSVTINSHKVGNQPN